MQDNAIRIAMWSGPRNISTAMMRSFENRADTVVIDEPFYACYLKATGLDHPGRDLILKEQASDWHSVALDLLAPLPKGKSVFYQKHMCHHMRPEIGLDWIAGMRHAFLIRDPRHMLASYVKSRAEVSLKDLGLERQLELFERVADETGKVPPVVDSADVLAAPHDKLEALCRALGIPFDAAMLSWPKGRRDSDGIWAPWWYASVEQSTGFSAPDDSKRDAEFDALPPEVRRIADEAQPIYEKLSAHKL